MLKHLTDEEIQLFAVEKANCELKITEHILLCAECKAKAEAYQLLIKGIRQQPQPVFDFDLSETILKQLPVNSPAASNDRLITWIFVSISVTLIGAGYYFFRSFLVTMFKGIAGISIYLIAISSIIIVVMLFVEMYKKYQQEMKVLNLN